jgi:hypothetical protein
VYRHATMGKHKGPERAGNKTYVSIKKSQAELLATQKHMLRKAHQKAKRKVSAAGHTVRTLPPGDAWAHHCQYWVGVQAW